MLGETATDKSPLRFNEVDDKMVVWLRCWVDNKQQKMKPGHLLLLPTHCFIC